MMLRHKSRHFNAAVIEHYILSVVICLGGFAMLLGALHTYPNAEEFELSSGPRDVGIIRSLANLFIRYDGRYSTNILHSINPLTINWINGYQLLPIVTILTLTFSLKYVLDMLFVAKHTYIIPALAMLSATVFLGSVPSICYTLYWAGASFVYLYPCIFSMLFIGSFIRYINCCKKEPAYWHFFSSSVFLFMGIGFNEMFLPFYTIVLSAIAIYFYLKDKTTFRQILPITVVGFLSILFFIAAPGVSARLNDSEKPFSIGIVTNNISNLSITLSHELTLPLTIFFLLYIFFLVLSKQITLTFSLNNKQVAALLLTMIGLPFCMAMAYYYPKQAIYGYPERIYAPVVFVFLLLQIVLITSLASRYAYKLSTITTTKPGKWYGVILLVGLGCSYLWGNNNILLLYEDFHSGRMTAFKTFNETRYAQLKMAAIDSSEYTTVLLRPMSASIPTSIFNYPDEETNRANSIWNKYHEEYFKINTIHVIGDTTLKFD